MWDINFQDELYHHGIKGQRWGVRRFQYENGSYTPAGEKRYADAGDNYRKAKAEKKAASKEFNKSFNKAYNYSSLHPISQNFGKNKVESEKRWSDAYDKGQVSRAADKKYKAAKKDYRSAKKDFKKETRDPKKALKTAAIIGASAATAALAIYGGKKVNDLIKNKATEIKIKETMADLRAQEMAIREWKPLSASDSALLWATRVETENNAINRLRNNSSKQKITEAAKLVYNDYKHNRR